LLARAKHACRATCCFAGTFKSDGRVKSLVTVAGGFGNLAFTVNALARRFGLS
jgi:hypothetical protein